MSKHSAKASGYPGAFKFVLVYKFKIEKSKERRSRVSKRSLSYLAIIKLITEKGDILWQEEKLELIM